MLFSKIFSAGAVMAATAMAALTPGQIADNLKNITKQSQDLIAVASNITVGNAAQFGVGGAPIPSLITGFADIVTSGFTTVSQLVGTPPVTGNRDATLIFNAFRDFVTVHQELLNILIGKAGILSKVPMVGAPVAAALRQLEGVVDTIAFGLIDLVEARSKDLQEQANSVDAFLVLTIQKFERL